ncbi:unnamed protein product, partial [Ectocarpus sp. 12 AP-2014]
RHGALWGETPTVPADRHGAAVLTPQAGGEEKGAAAATVKVHEDGRLLSAAAVAASAPVLPADETELQHRSAVAAAAGVATATGERGSNKPTESSTNAPPPRPPAQPPA